MFVLVGPSETEEVDPQFVLQSTTEWLLKWKERSEGSRECSQGLGDEEGRLLMTFVGGYGRQLPEKGKK